MVKNKLLEFFNVNNHEELMEHIKNNPEDNKVQEIKELLEHFKISLDSEVKIDE